MALHGALHGASRVKRPRARAIAIHGSISGVLSGTLIVIWAFAGGGTFWPIYPIAVLGGALGLHAALAGIIPTRQQQLVERVDELTRTRDGVLDVQTDELRRIERDLHDGAQARLVALTMQLGRAEARLEEHPEAAELVREARGEASAAIAELRDLARGIAPPVLADRGLPAAVEALARARRSRRRSTPSWTVAHRLSSRRPPTSSSPSRSPTRPSTRARTRGRPSRSATATTRSTSRSPTTATAAQTRPAVA